MTTDAKKAKVPEDLHELYDGPFAICIWHPDGDHEVTPKYSLDTLIERIASLTERGEKLAAALEAITKSWEIEGWTPENAKARTTFTDDTIERWRQAHAALADWRSGK